MNAIIVYNDQDCNNRGNYGKRKSWPLFWASQCITFLSVILLCELNAKFQVQLVGEIFQSVRP